MLLDYNPSKGMFFVRIPRSQAGDIQVFMREHGLDFSVPGSTGDTAVLFTREPYAAVTFFEHGTNAAKQQLAGINEQIEASRKIESHAHIKCPADKELWNFQKADIEYALNSRRGTLVGDQPGLGKTPIAICFANEISAKRVLVICPANIRLQWMTKIREWSTMRWPYIVHGILNSRNGVHPDAEWTVVSYDLARTESIGRALARGSYDLLIIDEAHYLKAVDSKRTRAVFGGGESPIFEALALRSQFVMALSGTPLPNRPREAYTLARGLHFDSIDWLSEEGFKRRFNPSMRVETVDTKTGKTRIFIDERTGRHAELQNRLRANFMCRHLKRDVMPWLKLPVYDLIHLEETTATKQALQAESLLDIDPEDLEGADAEVLGHVAVVRRLMGIAMAPQVADYIAMLIDGGEEKLVLFGWHIEVLNILEERLNKHGLRRIDGRTSAIRKQKHVDDFRSDRSIKVILGNIQSMGTGTDGLQDVACHALIAEPSWTPGENIQAFDRLDRGGQRHTVQGDIFVVPGSFAERVLAGALRKLQVTHKALDRRHGT